MKLSDFKIGERFWCRSGEYYCADVGSHFVIAIQITDTIRRDPSWLNGPPYGAEVNVFDAYDYEACYPTKEEYEANA
jgi:hypothetical protein